LKYIVEMENVTKQYTMGNSRINALDGATLAIGRGEMLSVMGPSGSGKTTLLNIIGCLDMPDSGVVKLDGMDISHSNEKERSRLRLHRIGFVFQQFFLIPTLTAEENIRLPMREARIPRRDAEARSKELLHMVGLGDRGNHRPSQLSGGEQQRVAVARAMANNPEIILADEPTGELDTANASRIVDLLRQLVVDKNVTVVVVTHDPGVAKKADKTVQMMDGKVL